MSDKTQIEKNTIFILSMNYEFHAYQIKKMAINVINYVLWITLTKN